MSASWREFKVDQVGKQARADSCSLKGKLLVLLERLPVDVQIVQA
jgi:hypothetical protein